MNDKPVQVLRHYAMFGFTLIELLAVIVCFAFSMWFTFTVVNLWLDLRNKSAGLQLAVIAALLVVGYVLAGCALYLLLRLLFLRGRPAAPPSGEQQKDEGPFMEYPSDDYESSLEAMTSAFERLKTGGYGDRWITFSGQGRGHDEESYQIEDVPVQGNTLDLRGEELDVPALLQFGKLQGQVQVEVDADGMVRLPGATPEQMARFLDAVFRKHFGIHPHDDEDDYAVGAEW